MPWAFGNGIDDRRMGMSVNETGNVVCKINARHAVDVGYIASLCLGNVIGMRFAIQYVAADTSREVIACLCINAGLRLFNTC